MIYLSSTKASQLICTGVSEFCIGGVILGLAYTISFGKYELTSIVGKGCPFWAGIPTVVTGIIGIITGIYKRKILLKVFLGLSSMCLVLGVLVTAVVGLMLNDWRTRGQCRFAFCSFDEPSILLIILVICWVLMSIMALTGILEACFPLVCHDEHSVRNTALQNGYPKRLDNYGSQDGAQLDIGLRQPLQTTV
ncbi:uncharacterized protein LOC110239024 [Exaiptasia diaphana]|uniref:Uncharacterized protein n=1 Tax=Exaiptasia diaphana TaxID=2652724 RepID=A0A913X7X1_EXADI|nr:uncharacterized protein LOC110239024 [Exaiptasia diaphana]